MTRNEIIDLYKKTGSVKAVAREVNAARSTVKRILLDAGIPVSDQSARAIRLYQSGKTVEEVAVALHIAVATAESMRPYSRGSYVFDGKTDNAVRIKRWREKKGEKEKWLTEK